MKLLLPVFLLMSLQAFPQNGFEAQREKIEQMANSNPEEALERMRHLMTSVKNAPESERAKAESTMALVKIYLADIDEAKKRNAWSLGVNKKNGNQLELARNYCNSALIAERESDYVNSVNYFLKVIAIAEKFGHYTLLQKSYRGLAMSYLDQRDYDKALEFALKSLSYQKQHNDPIQKAYSLAAVGEVFRSKQNLPEANRYFKQAYDTFSETGNEHGKAWVLTNWALCYESDLGKFCEMALQAQEIWDRIAPENTMSIMNQGNIAYNYMLAARDEIPLAAGNPKIPKTKAALLSAAETYFERCVAIARKKKNGNALMHQSYNLADLQYSMGKYRPAYDNLLQTLQLNDSIYSQQNKNKIAALESEKQLMLRDEKIRLDKLTLKNKQRQQWYFSGGLALLAVIGLLLFKQSRNRKRNNEKLQSLNDELDRANKVRARFFSILNHDLRSPVYNLIHYLQLQKDSPELLDGQMRQSIEAKNMAAAENLLSSMEDLLLWSKSQMENFSPEFDDVKLEGLFSDVQQYFSDFSDVAFDIDLDDRDMAFHTDRNYLLTILRNICGNAIKAMQDTPRPKITLKARSRHGSDCIWVSDNGPGADADAFRALYDPNEVLGIASGLGLHIIRDMAAAISCAVSVDSKPGSGTVFTLSFQAK